MLKTFRKYTLAFNVMRSVLTMTSQAAADESEITRQIGLDMLRQRMLQQIEQRRAIDWTPPGYFLVGYTVRVG